MMKFEIGDIVWVRAEFCGYHGSRDRLVLEVGNGEVIAVKSDCKTSPEFDIEKAIREVVLSDEFMKAFAKKAFGAKVEVALPTFTTLQNVSTERSLLHPIPGVNRPMRSDYPLAAGLVGVWVPNASAEAPKTANCPEIPDSLNPSESPNSSSETPAKTSSTQPPSGYRLLGPAKDKPRAEGDHYWSLAGEDWSPLWANQVDDANRDNWTACRKIEPPTAPPKQYREPTIEDLKNGPIECEVGDRHEKRTLVYVFDSEPGLARFVAVDEAHPNCIGRWIDCRIEVK